MIDKKTQPEMQDLILAIKRYTIANKNNVAFIGCFTGYNKDTCKECNQNDVDLIDDSKSNLFIYGDIEELRNILNDLRDICEDEKDEDGFVSI